MSGRLVLTALHVVRPRGAQPSTGTIRLTFPNHVTEAHILEPHADPEHDWVLLECDEPPPAVRPLPLASLTMSRRSFETFGFPDAQPIDGMVQSGTIENHDATLFGVPAYQLYSKQAAAGDGVPVQGSSGSPLIIDGAVVGVLRYALMTRDRVTRAGTLYACPATTVAKGSGGLLRLCDRGRRPAEGKPRDENDVDVFICYAREDRDHAGALATALEAEGWTVWWDHRLDAADTWSEVIEQKLDAARSVVVLWSEAGLKSDYVRDEASEARDRGVLVPALVEDVRPPIGFRQLQAANLEGWLGEPFHDGYRSVVRAVETLVPRDTSAATRDEPSRLPSEQQIRRSALGPPRIWAPSRSQVLTLAAAAVVTVLAAYSALQLTPPRLPEVPDEAQAMFERGVEQIHQAAYASATVALEEAITIHPEFPLAHARLAEARAQLDEQDRALSSLLRATTLVPDRSMLPRADSLYLEAISAMVTRDFPTAIERYTAVVESFPDRPEAHFELGRAYEGDDRVSDALTEYGAALRLDNGYAPAHLRRGILLGRQNEDDAALDALARAALLYQTASNTEGRAEAIYQRGVIFNNLRLADRAAVELELALSLAAANQQPDQQIRTLAQLSRVARNSGEDDKAEACVREALALSADRPQLRATALIDLGYVFYLRRDPDYDAAERHFREGIDVADRFGALRAKARAQGSLAGLLRGRDLDEVKRLSEDALAFYRNGNYRRETLQALSLLSFVQNLRGQLAEAEASFREQKAIAARLGDVAQTASAGINLGFVLRRRGNFPAALEEVIDARRLYEETGATRSIAYALRDEAANQRH